MKRQEAEKIAERILDESIGVKSGCSVQIVDLDHLRELIARELMLSRGGERAEDT